MYQILKSPISQLVGIVLISILGSCEANRTTKQSSLKLWYTQPAENWNEALPLGNGGAGTGWSRAWLINCSARLLDGKMAHEHIQWMFKKSIMGNLFALTGPFQIDGNFGFAAGLTEMLLQSHEGNTLRLLPALPPLWKEGSIKGIKARGGFTIDMEWKSGKLLRARISSEKGGTCNVNYEGEVRNIDLKAGEELQIKF